MCAAAVATLVMLTGCTDEPSGPGGGEVTSASPDSSGAADTATPVEPSPASPAATVPTTADGEWGSYESRADACAAIAADVVAIALLPVSLRLGGSERDVANTEDKIEDMKEGAPPELTSEFAHVQLLIDSFGERLAAGERGGGRDVGSDTSDAGDPARTDTRQGPRLDDHALSQALAPIKDWLSENCGNQPEG